jgi:hypothetical protein
MAACVFIVEKGTALTKSADAAIRANRDAFDWALI